MLRISAALLALILLASGHAEEPSVLVAAVGDVMLARTVPQRIAAHGPGWPWEKIGPLMEQADIRFCNLECAVTARGLAVPKRYSFRADPALTGNVLAAAGFSVASLANNHTYDNGTQGLSDTLAAVREMGIAGPGAGATREEAIAPRIVTVRGLKIAFVAYTCWTPEAYLPGEAGPRLATVDDATFTGELRAAKAGADFLVVSLHWGKEYSPVPTQSQRDLAYMAIDAGADLVIGHHPHVAQPVEIYRDRPILYSLGNCLFDRSGPQHSNGLLALVRFAPGRVTLEGQIRLRQEDARPIPEPDPGR